MGTLEDLISQFSGGQGNAPPTSLSGLMPSGNLSSLLSQYGIGNNTPAPTVAPSVNYSGLTPTTGSSSSGGGGLSGLLSDAGGVLGGIGKGINYLGGIVQGAATEGGRLIGHDLLGKNYGTPITYKTDAAGNNYAVDPTKADNKTYQSSALDPAALSDQAAQAQQGNLNPSLSTAASTIFGKMQPRGFGDFITGDPQRGITGLFHPNGQPGQASLTGAGINPIAAAGLGFLGDIGTNPLSYVAPEATTSEATGLIAEKGAADISAALGREVTPDLLKSIANGTADFSAASPEATAAAQQIAQETSDALGKVASKGVSSLTAEEAARYGINKGLQFKLPGLSAVQLTHGESPLANISQAFHGVTSGLAEKAAPLTDLFGKTPSEVRAGARAGDFESVLAKRFGNTYSLASSNIGRTLVNQVDQTFAGHSPEEISQALSAVENQTPIETLDPKVADLTSKINDLNDAVRTRFEANGIPIKPLEGQGYVPHPIQQDLRDAMTQAGLWPDRSGGTFDATKSTSFMEKGRTLWDPETKVGAIGQDGPGSQRITFTADTRAAAEAKANEIISARLAQHADPAWLEAHPQIAESLKNGDLNLWQEPADAYRSMARAAGRRIAEAQVGQKLYGAGVGILDPRFAKPSAGDASAFGVGGDNSPLAPTTNAPPDVSPPAAQTPLEKAIAEASAAQPATSPLAATGEPTTTLYRGTNPANATNAGEAADTGSWFTSHPDAAKLWAGENGTISQVDVPQSVADATKVGNVQYNEAGDLASQHQLPAEYSAHAVESAPDVSATHVKQAVAAEGQQVEQAVRAAVTRPPGADPVQASQESLGQFSQQLHEAMGIPPTPQTEAVIASLTQADQMVGAVPMSPEGQKYAQMAEQFAQSGDQHGVEWAQSKIVAANLDAAHANAEMNSSAALDRWEAAISDPATRDRIISMYRDQPIDYLQYKSLSPGILTPKGIAEQIIANDRVPDPTVIGSHWQSVVKFLRRWQLATPGLGARIGLTGVYENAVSPIDVGISDYADAGRMMLGARNGSLDAADAARLDRASQFVGLGQSTEFGGITALEGGPQGFMQSQARFNPFSSRGPLQRFIMAHFTQPAETMPRLAMVLNMMDSGASDDKIAEMVAHYHFDYSNLNPNEMKFRRNFMPGYNFMKNNVPLQVQTLIENPKIFGRVWAAKQEIEQQTGKDPVTPGYFMSLMNTALPGLNGGGHNYLSLASALPIGGLQQLANPLNEAAIGGGVGGGMGGFGSLAGQLSPVVSTPIEYMFGKQTDGLPLADNRAVPWSSLGMPTWLDAPLKAAGILGSVGGTDYITNKNLYVINKFLPFFARYQQATGGTSELPKIISFFTGQYFSTNTAKQQSSTTYFAGPGGPGKTLKSIVKSLNKFKATGG